MYFSSKFISILVLCFSLTTAKYRIESDRNWILCSLLLLWLPLVGKAGETFPLCQTKHFQIHTYIFRVSAQSASENNITVSRTECHEVKCLSTVFFFSYMYVYFSHFLFHTNPVQSNRLCFTRVTSNTVQNLFKHTSFLVQFAFLCTHGHLVLKKVYL